MEKQKAGRKQLGEFAPKFAELNNVTSEQGCRNNWHIHKATKDGGQILICVDIK